MKIILKNKKRFRIIFSAVSVLFLFIFLIINLYAGSIEYAEEKLSGRTFANFNTGCVIKTLGYNSETFSAAVSFYLPNGALIGSYERAWQGWELKLECIVLNLKSGAIVFPYRIFSDKSKYGTGVKLFSYYTKGGYPAIYDYSFFQAEEKEAVNVLFRSAALSPSLFLFFSSAQKQSIRLRNFHPDTEYALTVSPSGKIFLKKN